MTAFADKIQRRFYASSDHPYRVFERRVAAHLRPDHVLLDAGCGRGAPVLKTYVGKAAALIGVELVDFVDKDDRIRYINSDLANIPLPDESVDLVISRAVFEHLVDPDSVYRELSRLLRPGGRVVFLTASLWDYATIIARVVPNRYHSKIVAVVEGRKEEDVFPTAYKTNSRRQVQSLAARSGLEVESLEYLGQYPNYLKFNALLFLIGTAFDKLVSSVDWLKPLRGWILVTLKKPEK